MLVTLKDENGKSLFTQNKLVWDRSKGEKITPLEEAITTTTLLSNK